VPLAAHELGSGQVLGREPAEDAHGHLLRQPAPEHSALLLFFTVISVFVIYFIS
jgi:hypothetical protein